MTMTLDELKHLLSFQPTGGGEVLLELIRAGAMTRALVAEALQRHGLTPLEQELLERLSSAPGQSTTALARELHVERQTIERALNHLQTDGAVERRTSDLDRRAVAWQLTPEGAERLAGSRQSLAHLQATLLDDVPDAERPRFRELLRQVSDALRFEERRRLWAAISSRW